MNKQELIETLEEQVNCYRGCPPKKDYTKGRHAVLKDVLTIAKLLDEPQNPVVEPFVAEWFEDNKHALDLAIFTAIRELDGKEWPHETDFDNWLDNAENKPIETLFCMKDGYEVEKEPLYRVKIGEGYFVEYQGRGALIMPDCNKEIKIFDSKSDAERTAQTIGGTVEEVVEG
ncbi:DUF1642 domain-containing protein [Enterococcus faecium]|uniref:DUF1642 domain-containing protein n=1 Tax=Enterococcus faecium TaxID=1352 RepID=UPI000A33C074|nr:DUF1642 domain-containing protein [Enterococcus faecium]OTN91124.1 hypothetical protein A5809_000488 [Enterococcus faecium]